jgi:hypothetical protein
MLLGVEIAQAGAYTMAHGRYGLFPVAQLCGDVCDCLREREGLSRFPERVSNELGQFSLLKQRNPLVGLYRPYCVRIGRAKDRQRSVYML